MTTQNRLVGQVAATFVWRSLRKSFCWSWLIPFGLPVVARWTDQHVGEPLPFANVVEHVPLIWALCGFFTGTDIYTLLSGYAANYRWQLLPHYRRVYLTAVGSLACGLLVLPAAWFVWCSPERALSCIGLRLLMFSLGCCLILGRMNWAMLIGSIALAVGALLAWGADGLAAAQTWPGSVVCTVAGGILLAWFARRLWRLDEDDLLYTNLRVTAWALTILKPAAGSPLANLPSSMQGSYDRSIFLRLQEWRLERALGRGPSGFAWNVRRWSLISFAWLLPVVVIPVLAIAVLATRLIAGPKPAEFVAIAELWVTAAMVMTSLIQFQHRPTLGLESLRPVRRTDLIRQWGCGLLLRLVGLLALNIVLAICAFGPSLALAPPGALAWWSLWTVVPFGLAGLLTSIRTFDPAGGEFGLLGFGMMLFGAVMIFPVIAVPRGPIDGLGMLVATGGLLLAGSALFWVAYRRWLAMDLA